jgi:predicted Zn finger-like uncharacterized protein
MQIVCPNCETSYDVEASALGTAGRSVRCARCRTTWFAANTAALAEIAASHRTDIAELGSQEADVLPDWPPDIPRLGEPDREGDPPALGQDTPSIVADAEPASSGSDGETPVIDSPALAPTGAEAADAAPSEPEDIESVAARRALEQARRGRFGLRFPGWPAVAAALLLFDLGLVAWRADVVRMVPQTASLFAAIGMQVNLRGLAFADIRTTAQTEEVPVLLVQGRIVSTAKRTVEVPRLRFAALNASGTEIYSWTALPTRSLLGPGETLDFQSRLASPPPETREVQVRFFNRRDLASPIQ